MYICKHTHTDAHSINVFKEYLVTEIKFLLVAFLAEQTDLICQVGLNYLRDLIQSKVNQVVKIILFFLPLKIRCYLTVV